MSSFLPRFRAEYMGLIKDIKERRPRGTLRISPFGKGLFRASISQGYTHHAEVGVTKLHALEKLLEDIINFDRELAPNILRRMLSAKISKIPA